MPKAKPLIKWQKFWRLTVLWEYITLEWWKKTLEKCSCECWIIKWINRRSLRVWKVKSCWCLRSELWRQKLINADTTHGMSHSRIYRIYTLMRDRCINTNNKCFDYYWGRWIKCLWNSFEEFYNDMWNSYEEHIKQCWEKETTIDRIDVNWNYCKENCRRATWKEQCNNKRNNLMNRN